MKTQLVGKENPKLHGLRLKKTGIALLGYFAGAGVP
jgi:hypothetical protein